MIQCPLCGHDTVERIIDDEKTIKCPACGAILGTNPISGNIIWLKNGRVVMAEDDIKELKNKQKLSKKH